MTGTPFRYWRVIEHADIAVFDDLPVLNEPHRHAP